MEHEIPAWVWDAELSKLTRRDIRDRLQSRDRQLAEAHKVARLANQLQAMWEAR